MKVEIWSDIMCPYCYIGKRRFEHALEQFEHAVDIQIEWRSFQLNPDMETDPNANINEYLAETKGWSELEARQMNDRVTKMAAEIGLEYNMDQVVVANSFDAHRLIQYAKRKEKGDAAEEALFKAYFTDGKNIDDLNTLVEIAEQVGLDGMESREILEGDQYSNAVKHDIQTAKSLNIHGVPFFLFNRKFAVSGAQNTETFLKAIKQSWNDWLEDQPLEIQAEENGLAPDTGQE